MADETQSDVERRAIALAEQLGRFIGTVQRKADGWLDRKAITDEVTRIRDEASALLEQIGGSVVKPRQAAGAGKRKAPRSAAAAKGRSGGAVDAPGKKHRKRAPSARGAKHSDQRISKIAGAKTLRRGHRRG